jgi:hypothetical protein
MVVFRVPPYVELVAAGFRYTAESARIASEGRRKIYFIDRSRQ